MPVEAKDARFRFFTIGHSSHAAEHFVALLRQYAIGVIVDTRSAISLSESFRPRTDGPAWHFRIVAGVIAI
jgi:hypothetical protein